MVFVMNVPLCMAEKNIVCVHCSACVHPLPDCCRFYGDQLSCIDCYRRRHVIFVPHAIRDGDSSQLLAKKGTASNDVKTPPESNKKARLGEGKKNEDKNDEVAKKDGSDPDLKAAHQSNDAAKKEDDRKPAAVAKKMDDTTLKIKDPPPKRVHEEDRTDGKNPAAKENVQDKKKRRNARLPLHPNSTPLLPKLIGKSPYMDLDLEDTESESDDEILEDKPKPWKLITTLKEREIRNLKQAAKDRRKRGCRVRGILDEADLEALRATKKQKREERKLEIIQDCQERAYNAELVRREPTTHN
jgi:hypothetical protein